MASYCIIIHGGASYFPDDLISFKKEGIMKAALKGYEVLKKKGTALDAIEAAVIELENAPYFNAGICSNLTINGTVEMDAGIMDGKTLKAGAVGCVSTVQNPIQLARKIMENTEHTLIVEKGADALAESFGVRKITQKDLIHPFAEQKLKKYLSIKDKDSYLPSGIQLSDDHDTVGAVALDVNGNLATGTSTGGLTGQFLGRVGDCPVIGSGFYCDNLVGGVSTTGIGEAIATVCLAHRVTMEMEYGSSIGDAVKNSLDYMLSKTSCKGGVIALNKDGEMAYHFTESRMPWAFIKNDVLQYGWKEGEIYEEKL